MTSTGQKSVHVEWLGAAGQLPWRRAVPAQDVAVLDGCYVVVTRWVWQLQVRGAQTKEEVRRPVADKET